MREKYSQELAEIICQAIASEGTDVCGFEAAGISKNTFYQWLKKYPEFNAAIEAAREKYTRDRPESDKRQARKCLSDYLYNGIVIEWEITGETVRNIEDPDGTVKQVLRETFKKKHIERRQCPKWVLDRVLGKNTAILDALQTLLTEGVASERQAEIISRGVALIEKEFKQQEAESLAPEDLV
ncbi:MAG: hypothetical protein KME46_33495 [Brasilonema angustatum HA4187-MV1]|jgi:transposase-like protein|nr:hypothetical protein [Brasilonema angustatum HA4187-MV1]